MTKLAEKINTLALLVFLIFLTEGNSSQQVFAREVNLDTLCRDFPQNSRCKDYPKPSEAENSEDKIPRQENSENKDTEQNEAAKVIKLNVSATGGGEEWIRIEREGNLVKLLHTAPSLSGITEIGSLVTGFLGAPFPSFHNWNDHKTTRVVFKADNCSENLSSSASQSKISSQTAIAPAIPSSSCEITGTDSIELPPGMDISQGRFTMDYSDSDNGASIERSISFKVPEEEVKKASK